MHGVPNLNERAFRGSPIRDTTSRSIFHAPRLPRLEKTWRAWVENPCHFQVRWNLRSRSDALRVMVIGRPCGHM